MKKVRCAIYTRKSSEEGLEQGFNSLDAQREACAAYILSQASEGWSLIPDFYDDGGISGGTLERPALQRLLADIATGRIDIVVVYKVDRLSRSLFDFAKLVEVFEQADVSFVSVTQSFNTTTSMGRLTLNMLLSFAQFEREVTAERIRDKLAASKAKGMWMGGTPPLGYRPNERSLAIVPEHAKIIRDIYRDYLTLGTVRLLAERLAANGSTAPVRTTATGKRYGGGSFSRGQLYFILKNPIYAGDIPHRGKVYPGQHPAIIDRTTWDQVQAMLASHVQGDIKRTGNPHQSLLAGLIVDATGEPMQASHASKGEVRYRYYVGRSSPQHSRPLRLPAREIENLVKTHTAQMFDDPLLLTASLGLDLSPALLRDVTDKCAELAMQIRARPSEVLPVLVSRVRALSDRLEIDMSVTGIAGAWGTVPARDAPETLPLSVHYRLSRTGQALRVIQGDGTRNSTAVDPPLLNLLLRARKWWAILSEGEIDIATLAKREGFNDSYVTRVVRVAFLSPAIVEAVLNGSQHRNLDATVVRSAGTIPADWDAQRRLYLQP